MNYEVVTNVFTLLILFTLGAAVLDGASEGAFQQRMEIVGRSCTGILIVFTIVLTATRILS